MTASIGATHRAARLAEREVREGEIERPTVDASFVPDGAGGHRLYVMHTPASGAPRALVLHSPAFGEESNLSRRQVAETARALAQAGIAVLLADPQGCGDSSGEQGEAGWSGWNDDLVRAMEHLRRRWPGTPLWLWSQRAGTLCAAGVLTTRHPPDHHLLWQPMVAGIDLMRHWQRQAAAAALVDGQVASAAVAVLREAWSSGRTMEVGGMTVAASLASAAEARRFLPPPQATPGCLCWLDVQPRPGTTPGPPQQACLDQWARAGWRTNWGLVEGPPFWQGPEVSTVPALTRASVEAILAECAA